MAMYKGDESMKTHQFKVTLQGDGNTREEAWMDAVNAFAENPGIPPTKEESEQYWS